MMQGWRY